MSTVTFTTNLVSMSDNTRYAPVPGSSNRTGVTFGILLVLRNRKMTLMALTE